jgi:nucleotide-binding universal stress UspA family protein
MNSGQFKNILVPIDGSDHSLKALDYALEFANRFSSNIHIIIAYSLTAETFNLIQRVIPRPMADSYQRDVKERNEQILVEAVQHAQTVQPDLKITKSIVQGRPADKIVEIASTRNIDLIIMGSRGIGGIKGVLLGSVADRVADHAACPVMIVK